jgi:hypothetical protein
VEEFKDSDTEENAENSAMQMKEDSLPPLLANNTSEFGTVTENEEETHKAENFEELEFMVKANKKEEKNEKKPEAPREKSYIALMGEMEPGNLKITDPESSDEDEKITKKPKTSKNPQ